MSLGNHNVPNWVRGSAENFIFTIYQEIRSKNTLAGFYLLEGVGGKLPPQTLQLPPKIITKCHTELCINPNI